MRAKPGEGIPKTRPSGSYKSIIYAIYLSCAYPNLFSFVANMWKGIFRFGAIEPPNKGRNIHVKIVPLLLEKVQVISLILFLKSINFFPVTRK